MSLTDQLLAALLIYGIPVLFGVVVVAAVGIPIPVSLMLVAAGSFVAQGDLNLTPVLLAAGIGAILGDQLGYWLARWGGRSVVSRFVRRFGGEESIGEAEALSKRWGGAGIFLSRWLVTQAGPWINITSGISEYPWRRFLFWDVLGEAVWVCIYVTLGYVFSDRVQFIVEILGNLTWVILGLIVASILGWRIVRFFRNNEPIVEPATGKLIDGKT